MCHWGVKASPTLSIVANISREEDRAGTSAAQLVTYSLYIKSQRPCRYKCSAVDHMLPVHQVTKAVPVQLQLVTWWRAGLQVGAVLVNVNPAYRLSELQYVLDQSEATTIVLAPGLRDADFVSMLEQTSGEGPVLRRRIVLGDSPPRGPSWFGWADVLNAGDHPLAASALRVCRCPSLLLSPL